MHSTYQFSTIFSSYSFINPKFPNFNRTSHKFKTIFSYQSPNSLHDANLNNPGTKISSLFKTLKSKIDAENTINNISNLENAILVLRNLPDETKPKTHLKHYNRVFKLFREIRGFKNAENLFDEMLQRGLKPNTLTFSNLIRCAVVCGLPHKAVELFEKMPAFGCEPDYHVFSSMVYAQTVNVDMDLKSYDIVKKDKWHIWLTDDVVKMFNQFWDFDITPDDRLCDCLLYVMTQIPKEELGKITNCIEKANPKLGNILTYLMEEKEDDGYFLKEVSELLSAANEHVKMSLCNNLIDICYNLGVEDKARDLLGLGLWLEIYSNIQLISETQWCLNLKKLSVGVAMTALHVWLDDLFKAFESGEELPQVLGICWSHKPSDKDLASVFESYLKELNSPFHKAANMTGWYFTTSQEAKSWLQSRGSTETVADLNSSVLDVPAEALPH